MSVDLTNRDPNSINDHLTCHFEDVLAEPGSTHSLDCVWRLSYSCFTLWKSLCYKVATTLCGLCAAAEWGCEFAVISFLHIWYFTPCFKVLDINCGCLRKMWSQCIKCCVEPLCESCSVIFSAFRRE